MIAFEQAIRPFVPVVAHVKQKVISPVIERPEVGIRWGKPSKFEHSNEDLGNKEQPPVAVEYLGKTEKVTGTEVYRKWERVETPYRPPEEPLTFEFERPVEMYFFTHEEEHYEEKPYGDEDDPNSNPNHIQPEITIVYHYVKFAFPLNNPEDNVIASGERGEHPDAILERKKAEYYSTVAGQNQASKEYWEGVFEEVETWATPSWAQ